MRDQSDIPSSERETVRWRVDRLPVAQLEPPPALPWSRREIAMAAVATVCALVAAAIVITGILPLIGV